MTPYERFQHALHNHGNVIIVFADGSHRFYQEYMRPLITAVTITRVEDESLPVFVYVTIVPSAIA